MLKAAIVGLGWWGREIVKAVYGNSDVLKFTHAADINPESACDFAEAYNLKLCNSFDQILKISEIEAVVLATPHSIHVEQIIASAKAGKHIYCEKPLALDLFQATRAVDACQNYGVVFALGTDRRFLPAIIKLKDMVETDFFGEIMQVEAQYSNDNMSKGITGGWRFLESEAPGAGMTGPGLHALDSLINLAGPVKEIAGHLSRPFGAEEPIDAISLMMEFENGVRGLLGCVRGCPRYFRLTVYGSKGWGEVREFNELHFYRSRQERSVQYFEPGRATRQTLDQFAMAVKNDDEFPVSTTSMLQTVAAFETVIKSFKSNKPKYVPTVESRYPHQE